MRWRSRLGVFVVASALAVTASAQAFDAGPHADITRDALSAEGFGNNAIEAVQVSSWFNDVYDEGSVDANPYLGHAGWKSTVWGFIQPNDTLRDTLQLGTAAREAAGRMHFDSSEGGYSNTREVDAEWGRLARRTRELVRFFARRGDKKAFLVALGASLHQVQDFYAHSNWVERAALSPHWELRGYGRTPTWFDVPSSTRGSMVVYVGGSDDVPDAEGDPGLPQILAAIDRLIVTARASGRSREVAILTQHRERVERSLGRGPRNHGTWRSVGERFMNKDWQGRPLYEEAHLAAYFASRQWVQAVRMWVGDEAFWRAALSSGRPAGLGHDLSGMREISFYAGHWQGQGEPAGAGSPGDGGSADDLVDALEDYFDRPSPLRSTWLDIVVPLAAADKDVTWNTPDTSPISMPCVRQLQRDTRFIRLEVTELHGDLDPPLDDSDFFVTAGIGGQAYLSGMIHGYSDYRFTKPSAPFTFLKAVPRAAIFPQPLTSLEIEVKTGDVAYAGTDDDVFLRINDTTRFELFKRGYDDFERADRARYSLPIDDQLRKGISVNDIRYLQIEKSPDGDDGGWRLAGIRVWVNGIEIYRNESINRWLGESTRIWRAGDFSLATATGAPLPVWLALWDDDGGLYGDADHADINLLGLRRDVAFTFDPRGGENRGHRLVRGGYEHGGREGDGDEASLKYRIWTVDPVVGSKPCPSSGIAPVATAPPSSIAQPVVSKSGGAAPPAPSSGAAAPAASSGTVAPSGSSGAPAVQPVSQSPSASAGAVAPSGSSGAPAVQPVSQSPSAAVTGTRASAPTTQLPDLVIKGLTERAVSVWNRGTANAGPFSVQVGTKVIRLRGLAAGASFTSTYACLAGPLVAMVDSLKEVVESDEGNNTFTAVGKC